MKSLLFALLVPVLAVFAADSTSAVKVSSFNFKVPEKWKSVQPTSSMRKAQLSAPGDAGAAEVIFFHFGPGDGGGTQANIDRWFNQFKDAQDKKSENATIGGRKVIWVSTRGTYSSGMPGGAMTPMPNHSLLGAIIEDTVNGNVFVKMTGPTKTVQSSEPAFRQMVKSAVEAK
jgi:hypothetical protein